jgi:hypothetical protein
MPLAKHTGARDGFKWPGSKLAVPRIIPEKGKSKKVKGKSQKASNSF